MPFELKNVRATFQRLINKVFFEHIGKNIEAYMDNIIVKSKTLNHHMEHLNEVFYVLRRHNIKLNLKEYVFGSLPTNF